MKTPRTDAAEWDYYEDCTPVDSMIVSADFARQLETELAAMTALADRLAEALMPFVKLKPSSPRVQIKWPSFIHEGRETLAAYENHKQKTS